MSESGGRDENRKDISEDGDRIGPRMIDGAFYFLCGLVVVTGGIALWMNGFQAIPQAFQALLADSVFIVPLVILGVVVGALFTMLVPRAVIARYLGQQAGFRGILLATLMGTAMPGGPFASFPIVFALGRSGAGTGALIAFLVAWAAVGLNRLIQWEIPFMGVEFAAVRFISSLPLPIIAGVLADKLSEHIPYLRMKWGE